MSSFSRQAARLLDAAPALLDHALRTGGEYADLFYERSLHHRLRLRQTATSSSVGRANLSEAREVVEGVGARALAGAQQGFATTKDCSVESVQAATEAAAAQVKGKTRAASLPLSALPPSLPLPPDAPDGISHDAKKHLMEAAADTAFSLDARVCRVEVEYQDRVRRTLVATSESRVAWGAGTLLGMRIAVTLEADDHPVTAYALAGGAGGFDFFLHHPPEDLAREAVARALRLAGAGPISPGKMPVVLAGGWGGVWLHEAAGHLLEADVFFGDHGPRTTAHGAGPVAALDVTVLDDATLAGGRGSCRCDDEGTPAARTLLVEDGERRGLLTDRRTASRFGLPGTGNARRQDYRFPPLPRMTNLLLLPGPTPPEDLVADVRDGLFVRSIGQGRVRPERDVFSFEVLEGHRIEKGKCSAPVTGVWMEGKLSEALANVAGVGSDFSLEGARGWCKKGRQVVPVSVGMPSVLLRGLEVNSES